VEISCFAVSIAITAFYLRCTQAAPKKLSRYWNLRCNGFLFITLKFSNYQIFKLYYFILNAFKVFFRSTPCFCRVVALFVGCYQSNGFVCRGLYWVNNFACYIHYPYLRSLFKLPFIYQHELCGCGMGWMFSNLTGCRWFWSAVPGKLMWDRHRLKQHYWLLQRVYWPQPLSVIYTVSACSFITEITCGVHWSMNHNL